MATVLLGLWLIFTGCIALAHLTMEWLPIVMGILALAAGVCLLLGW